MSAPTSFIPHVSNLDVNNHKKYSYKTITKMKWQLQCVDNDQYRYLSNVDTFKTSLKLEISPAYDRQKRREVLHKSLKFSYALWRKSFVAWCYKIVDLPQFYFNRETVDIALSYLDGYLYKKGADVFDDDDTNATLSGQQQGKRLKISIISYACVFLAIKLHESNHQFDIPTLVRLNNEQFTRQDIVEAERDILTVLDFSLSPPTIMSFVRVYLAFLDGTGSTIMIDGEVPLSKEAIKHVTGLAKFLSELSMYDAFFADKDVSKIALACVLTAFEGISCDDFPQAYRQTVVDCVFKEGKLDCTDETVYECRIKLRGIFQARHAKRLTRNEASNLKIHDSSPSNQSQTTSRI